VDLVSRVIWPVNGLEAPLYTWRRFKVGQQQGCRRKEEKEEESSSGSFNEGGATGSTRLQTTHRYLHLFIVQFIGFSPFWDSQLGDYLVQQFADSKPSKNPYSDTFEFEN